MPLKQPFRFVTQLVAAVVLGAFALLTTQRMVLAQDDASQSDAASRQERIMEPTQHMMSPEMYDAMREVVPLLKEYSDERIQEDMDAMPNYSIYVSEEGLAGDVGILALGHGYREHGDLAFEAAMGPVSQTYPLAVGYGMAMMISEHFQLAVDRLTAKGAETIVVLPFTSTPGGKMVRQWEYIFGLRDEPGYLAVPRVETTANIVFADFAPDDPVISTILRDHARELIDDPQNATAIVVVHGPTSDEMNRGEVALMEEHAARIKETSDFSDVIAFSIQDDAPTAVRTANVDRLRALIQDANADGKEVVLVTKLLMSEQFLHKKLRERDLPEQDFKLSTKGITAHPAFAEWVDHAIAASLEKREASADSNGKNYEAGYTFKACKDVACPEMVVVMPGTFMMGSPEDEENRKYTEGPQHEVKISSPFVVSKYHITFDEWDACVAAGGCNDYSPDDEGWGRGTRPVNNVNWHDAQAYLSWLSEKSGKTYRLLSEAEWEYAARAGAQTMYSWGDEIGDKRAVCKECGTEWDDVQSAPVGSFEPNAFGLYGMHGNLWEWVEDCWNDSYRNAPTDGSADMSGDCEKRVLRGGSWNHSPQFLRSARRYYNDITDRYYDNGFRIARTLD